MDLVSFSIKGWRRFVEKTTLQTNGKIVSLLGPNEAGKSSILRALHFLRSADDIDPRDVSRGLAADDVELKGYFALSPTEIKGAGLSGPTRLVLKKGASGSGTFVLDPEPPPRDIVRRRRIAEQLDKCLNNPKFMEAVAEEQLVELEGLQESLKEADGDLDSDQIRKIRELSTQANKINYANAPQYVRSLGDALADLADSEAQPSPWTKAINFVRGKIPQILFFGDEERDLRQEYNIDGILPSPPTALANLASIAGLNIQELVDAVNVGDVAEVESIKARANHQLKERFDETWSQSGVHVSITVTNRILNIVIENEPFRFTNLAERSDGFRQFVALQSFTMKEHANRPILLIDEAEQHLHYDAQADIVQMLSRQEVASKVVYSTHSAGCLPEDLGNGVRLVSQTGPSSSKVINRFWGTPQPGFSPLLIGMGASTLAFFPTRKALMVEGESEMLLLPTMLREALGQTVLGFQTVPGLSKANKGLLPLTGGEANHIAYLTDGDDGGRALAKEIRKNGVNEAALFELSVSSGADCQLEDFIDSKVLGEAVNELIRKFTPGARAISLRKLPETGKFAALSAGFTKSTKKELMKVDLAYEILQLASDRPQSVILDADHKEKFQAAANDIARFLIPPVAGRG